MQRHVRKLVTATGPVATGISGPATGLIDPAFMGTGLRPCDGRLSTHAETNLGRHLAFAVSRRPRDLLQHTRRVLLQHQRNDADACYAALLDLFYVLEDHGAALKRRLLKLTAPMFDAARRECLHNALHAGELRLPADPGQRFCRLARGHRGLRLVRRLDS